MNTSDEARKLLFKYDEDKILEEALEYIKGTYTQHYTGDENIQIQDVFNQM